MSSSDSPLRSIRSSKFSPVWCSYEGTTTITSGGLIFNGDASAATGAVNVDAGGWLGGSGTFGGATTISGTLSPGKSPGTVTFVSDLTIADGGEVIFEAGDLIDVEGTLALMDNWTLTLTDGFQDGGTTLLFTYGTLAGSPDLSPTFDISGLGFIPSGPLTLFDTGDSIYLNGISAVPEPAVWGLCLGGLSVLILRRRPFRRFRE